MPGPPQARCVLFGIFQNSLRGSGFVNPVRFRRKTCGHPGDASRLYLWLKTGHGDYSIPHLCTSTRGSSGQGSSGLLPFSHPDPRFRIRFYPPDVLRQRNPLSCISASASGLRSMPNTSCVSVISIYISYRQNHTFRGTFLRRHCHSHTLLRTAYGKHS